MKKISISVPDDLHERIKMTCQIRRDSMSDMGRALFQQWLDSIPPTPQPKDHPELPLVPKSTEFTKIDREKERELYNKEFSDFIVELWEKNANAYPS